MHAEGSRRVRARGSQRSGKRGPDRQGSCCCSLHTTRHQMLPLARHSIPKATCPGLQRGLCDRCVERRQEREKARLHLQLRKRTVVKRCRPFFQLLLAQLVPLHGVLIQAHRSALWRGTASLQTRSLTLRRRFSPRPVSLQARRTHARGHLLCGKTARRAFTVWPGILHGSIDARLCDKALGKSERETEVLVGDHPAAFS